MLVHELLYADDTLLIEADEATLEKYMRCVTDCGNKYGLSLNWTKVEVLPVCCNCGLKSPSGETIKQQQRLVYLGSVLSADGTFGSEISRRIGSAKGEFDKLCRVWKHSSLATKRKVRIFEACVMSKLLYNLHSLCLTQAETNRLDAFHVRCLRRVLKIAPSFYSRVPNKDVLQAAGTKSASHMLLERQLLWMGGLAARPDDHILRKSIFKQALTFEPKSTEGRI